MKIVVKCVNDSNYFLCGCKIKRFLSRRGYGWALVAGTLLLTESFCCTVDC